MAVATHKRIRIFGEHDGERGWLEFLEGARFESSRQNLPKMRTFLARYFSDTANASASVIR